MKIAVWCSILAFFLVSPSRGLSSAEPLPFDFQPSDEPPTVVMLAENNAEPSQAVPEEAEENFEEEAQESIADPLEPINRAFFHFNDKLYFWLLKPVAQGYKYIFPQELRICVSNVFSTVLTPVRFVNSLLQGKFKAAGNEAFRFGVNTTLGFFGCVDQAKDKFDVPMHDEDLGQTFGFWGMGPAFYIEWPILGPSSLRDTIGFVGDFFLDPRTYFLHPPLSYANRPVEIVNETSLRIGDYEDLKAAAIDPYVAIRDAYHQYRMNKIRDNAKPR